MPKYPRQSVCAVIGFGFAFALVAGILIQVMYITDLDQSPLGWAANYLLALLFVFMHIFAVFGCVGVAGRRDKVKGGPFLVGTVVIIAMMWISFAVKALVGG